MKTTTTKNRITETAIGSVLGAAIAGPIGAVVGGLAAGNVEPGLNSRSGRKPSSRRRRQDPDDPIIHAHLKRILVPLDFAPPSRRALRFAAAWARLFGAEIRLLHVIDPIRSVGEFGTVPLGQVHRDLAGKADAALRELARSEFPDSPRLSVEVRKGAPYDEIVAAANRWKADLVLIATHGRSGLKHALMGSTAERVVRHASCPVLTLRRAPTRRASKT